MNRTALVLAVLVLLAGCSGTTDRTASTETPSETTTRATPSTASETTTRATSSSSLTTPGVSVNCSNVRLPPTAQPESELRPRAYPSSLGNSSSAAVRAFVIAFESAYRHNEIVSTYNATTTTVSITEVTVRNASYGYAVQLRVDSGFETPNVTATDPYRVGYAVTGDGVLRSPSGDPSVMPAPTDGAPVHCF